ncbi:hypothetical protein Slin15195_G033320 [Septoria linicola]|uniref:F-box domain-containing protein n=1 Tax=Septoria linicola TaxID=215465 RepID=A0A9Q9EI64_9PEZI|nr:hypothetical protein Slin14017_G032340 [Septoria linicola]USW50013.1 hypothetical protein Slin15195_G033320 [Septoria linicola]
MGASFLSLPEELQDHIISHLSRPTDLQKLYITCKQIRQRVRPFLYRSIKVFVDDDNSDTRLLASDKIGQKHIKQLIFTIRKQVALELRDARRTSLVSMSEEKRLIGLVLHALPRDSLQQIIIPSGQQLDAVGIFSRQKSVRHMALGPLLLRGYKMAAIKQWAPNLSSLVVPSYIESLRDLKYYGDIIRISPRLEHLAIRSVVCMSMFESDPAPTCRGKSEHGALFERLLHELETPLCLRSLRLYDQSLLHLGPKLATRIDFEKLEALHMYKCVRQDSLFDTMAQLYRTSSIAVRLKVLVVHLHIEAIEDNTEPDTTAWASLQSMLKSFNGLEALHLRFDVNPDQQAGASFDVRCLEGHTATLKSLYIGLGSNEDWRDGHWRIPAEAAVKLFRDCKQLSEISLAMPGIHLLSDILNDDRPYQMAIDTIAQLASLRLLRILTWPLAFEEHNPYMCHVDAHATNIVARFARAQGGRPSLKILCIGDTLDNDQAMNVAREEWIMISEPRCYVVGHQRDCYGRDELAAIPVPIAEVKYLAPEFRGVAESGSGLSSGHLDCMDVPMW